MTDGRIGQMTPRGRKFVSRKIRRLRREGVKRKQAVAIALSIARKRGFKVPRRKK